MRRADYWSNQAPSNFPFQNTPRLFGIPNDEDKGTLTTSLFTRALFVTALAIGRFVISLDYHYPVMVSVDAPGLKTGRLSPMVVLL